MPGTKRKRNGDSWLLEVYCGSDYTGKPLRYSRTVHCKSAAAADKELAKFYAECEAGMVSKQDRTKLAAFAELWYEEYAKRYYKKSALHGERTAIDKWITPLLGEKKLARIQRMDVQMWVNHLVDQGLSPSTLRNYYSSLTKIMKYALELDLISDTPCKNIRLPKKTKREARYYSMDEVKILIKSLQNLPEEEQPYKCAVLLFLFGGLRRAEALGLDWSDVSFDRCEIQVRQTRMTDRSGKIFEDTPKTSSSVRTLTLPQEVMSELRKLRLQQMKEKMSIGEKYEDCPAVLQKHTGGVLYPTQLYRWFTRFISDSGLPAIGLHGLRHTHTSMLIYMGTDKIQVSERLGHSDLTTTLNIYTHLFENADKKIAEDLSAQFLAIK